MTLLIVNPWQSSVCFIRSGATWCTLLVVLYLDRMCQCGLHAVLWPHIGTLMHRLAAEPQSTAGLLFPCQCPSGAILIANPVFDGVGLAGFKSRAYAFLLTISCSIPTIVIYYFSLSRLSVCRLVLWGWGLLIIQLN